MANENGNGGAKKPADTKASSKSEEATAAAQGVQGGPGADPVAAAAGAGSQRTGGNEPPIAATGQDMPRGGRESDKVVRGDPLDSDEDEFDPNRRPSQEELEERREEYLANARREKSEAERKLIRAAAAKNRADAEYAQLQAEARMANEKILSTVGTNKRPTTITEYAAQEKARGAELVPVMIPKAFQLRLDDHTLIDVQAGMRRVPRALANHWWFAANGVVADAE